METPISYMAVVTENTFMCVCCDTVYTREDKCFRVLHVGFTVGGQLEETVRFGPYCEVCYRAMYARLSEESC